MRDRATEVALFRYALIREAADPGLSTRQRGRLVREIASGPHLHPDGMEVTVGRSTLDEWIVLEFKLSHPLALIDNIDLNATVTRGPVDAL